MAAGRRSHITVSGRDYETPDGSCIRDDVHVLDLCQAHRLALDWLVDDGASAAFNLGNGNGFSVLEVIRAAETVTGRKLKIEEWAAPQRRPPRLVADSGLIHRQLSWLPAYSDLETIVKHAWAWENRAPKTHAQ